MKKVTLLLLCLGIMVPLPARAAATDTLDVLLVTARVHAGAPRESRLTDAMIQMLRTLDVPFELVATEALDSDDQYAVATIDERYSCAIIPTVFRSSGNGPRSDSLMNGDGPEGFWVYCGNEGRCMGVGCSRWQNFADAARGVVSDPALFIGEGGTAYDDTIFVRPQRLFPMRRSDYGIGQFVGDSTIVYMTSPKDWEDGTADSAYVWSCTKRYTFWAGTFMAGVNAAIIGTRMLGDHPDMRYKPIEVCVDVDDINHDRLDTLEAQTLIDSLEAWEMPIVAGYKPDGGTPELCAIFATSDYIPEVIVHDHSREWRIMAGKTAPYESLSAMYRDGVDSALAHGWAITPSPYYYFTVNAFTDTSLLFCQDTLDLKMFRTGSAKLSGEYAPDGDYGRIIAPNNVGTIFGMRYIWAWSPSAVLDSAYDEHVAAADTTWAELDDTGLHFLSYSVVGWHHWLTGGGGTTGWGPSVKAPGIMQLHGANFGCATAGVEPSPAGILFRKSFNPCMRMLRWFAGDGDIEAGKAKVYYIDAAHRNWDRFY